MHISRVCESKKIFVNALSTSLDFSFYSGGDGKINSDFYHAMSNSDSGISSSGVKPFNFSKWIAASFVRGKLRTM